MSNLIDRVVEAKTLASIGAFDAARALLVSIMDDKDSSTPPIASAALYWIARAWIEEVTQRTQLMKRHS